MRKNQKTKLSDYVDVGGCDASAKCIDCQADHCPEVDIAASVVAIRQLLATAEPTAETVTAQQVQPNRLQNYLLPNSKIHNVAYTHQRGVDAYTVADNYRKCRCGSRVSKYTDRCPKCGEY